MAIIRGWTKTPVTCNQQIWSTQSKTHTGVCGSTVCSHPQGKRNTVRSRVLKAVRNPSTKAKIPPTHNLILGWPKWINMSIWNTRHKTQQKQTSHHHPSLLFFFIYIIYNVIYYLSDLVGQKWLSGALQLCLILKILIWFFSLNGRQYPHMAHLIWSK